MPPFNPVYVINALEMPADPVARASLYSVQVGGPAQWASSPATTPGWGNALSPPVNNGSAFSTASVGWPDATSADRQACATALGASATAVVSSVSPNTGPVGGGTSVRISGTRLAGSTGVNFGSTASPAVTVLNEATIVAVTPAGTAGAKAVQVVNPNGNASLAGGFTFQ